MKKAYSNSQSSTYVARDCLLFVSGKHILFTMSNTNLSLSKLGVLRPATKGHMTGQAQCILTGEDERKLIQESIQVIRTSNTLQI